ncbi:MAG: hypothetical protein COC24_001350 [Alphaproteobacteria bacterium]|nr:hypothetical protein [Alphaproteobacteria bacterium]
MMADKPFIDVSTIAGGGFVGYASIIGDIETGLGLLLVVFTLILTVMRILIAINEWRSRRK